MSTEEASAFSKMSAAMTPLNKFNRPKTIGNVTDMITNGATLINKNLAFPNF